MKGTINWLDSCIVCAVRQERRKEGMPLGMFGSVKRSEGSAGEIYAIIYSEGNNSVRLVFKLWEKDGNFWIHIDNPVIDLDGKKYVMNRPIRNSDYSFDTCLEHYIEITFWGVPFSNGFVLNGGFIFIRDNRKLV